MADSYNIKLRINREEDLYNPFDTDEETISDDVISYVYQRYQEKRMFDRFVIHIVSDTEIDIDKVRAVFTRFLRMEQMKLKRKKRRNSLKQLWMFGIGVAFILVGIVFRSKLPELPSEVISTIGAFSLWEAASIWIVQNPEIRMKRTWLETMLKTEIVWEAPYSRPF